MVVTPPRQDFFEVTYLHDMLGYGKIAPFPADLNSAEADYLVLPFCKNEALPGKWWVIAYTNEDSVTVNERKRWTHSTKLEGAWAGKSAGGCIEHDSWKDNPQYK